MGSFEDRITGGLAQWLTFVESNDDAGTVRIGLTHHPETSSTERWLDFKAVTRVGSVWHDRDDGCLEGLIGAGEEDEGDQWRYWLFTDQRELSIWSKEAAHISESGSFRR